MIELKNISHGYNNISLFENLNLNIYRGDRIGIIGPNGGGKSTLLRLINGSEIPNFGYVGNCNNLEINHFAQNTADTLDPYKTVLETIQEFASSNIEGTELRALLGQFMFKGKICNFICIK